MPNVQANGVEVLAMLGNVLESICKVWLNMLEVVCKCNSRWAESMQLAWHAGWVGAADLRTSVCGGDLPVWHSWDQCCHAWSLNELHRSYQDFLKLLLGVGPVCGKPRVQEPEHPAVRSWDADLVKGCGGPTARGSIWKTSGRPLAGPAGEAATCDGGCSRLGYPA